MGPGMQDAQEFYARILSEEGSGDGSLSELTVGVNRQWTTCRGCSRITKTDQDLGTLCAPVISSEVIPYPSMEESLLLQYPQISTIRKRCYNTHSEGDSRECDHSVRSDWIVAPAVLVVHAIRFGHDGDKIHPIGRDMTSPPVLHLQGSTYALCSVVEHIGESSRSGHYVAYAKDIGFAGWFRFDDGDVSRCSEEDATRHPYLAMYQKLVKLGTQFYISDKWGMCQESGRPLRPIDPRYNF